LEIFFEKVKLRVVSKCTYFTSRKNAKGFSSNISTKVQQRKERNIKNLVRIDRYDVTYQLNQPLLNAWDWAKPIERN